MKRKCLTIGFVLVCMTALAGCAPRSFIRTSPGWKVIELRKGLASNYSDSWQTMVDTVARNWDIEILDRESGYLRTAWHYGISGGVYKRYRGRLVIKFPTIQEVQQVEVKTEAQWFVDTNTGWLSGFDSLFHRDVYSALSGRLGRTVPID